MTSSFQRRASPAEFRVTQLQDIMSPVLSALNLPASPFHASSSGLPFASSHPSFESRRPVSRRPLYLAHREQATILHAGP